MCPILAHRRGHLRALPGLQPRGGGAAGVHGAAAGRAGAASAWASGHPRSSGDAGQPRGARVSSPDPPWTPPKEAGGLERSPRASCLTERRRHAQWGQREGPACGARGGAPEPPKGASGGPRAGHDRVHTCSEVRSVTGRHFVLAPAFHRRLTVLPAPGVDPADAAVPLLGGGTCPGTCRLEPGCFPSPGQCPRTGISEERVVEATSRKS